MANIKISSLEETKINNPDASFVMVVAKDDPSNLYKNFRISLTELRNIIGSIEGDIVAGVTEQDVIDIVNSAISADNLDELTSGTVEEMIERAIANIPVVEPGLSESEVQTMINSSIAADNRNELTVSQVSTLIDTKIAAIPEVTPGLSETEVQDMIDSAISELPVVEPGLSETEVQDMIDASITTDNLKEHIETVIPDVIPEVLPEVIPDILPETTIEVTSDILETPTTVKIVEVAEKTLVNEIELTKIKEVTEDCVCHEHADDCFTEIFK